MTRYLLVCSHTRSFDDLDDASGDEASDCPAALSSYIWCGSCATWQPATDLTGGTIGNFSPSATRLTPSLLPTPDGGTEARTGSTGRATIRHLRGLRPIAAMIAALSNRMFASHRGAPSAARNRDRNEHTGKQAGPEWHPHHAITVPATWQVRHGEQQERQQQRNQQSAGDDRPSRPPGHQPGSSGQTHIPGSYTARYQGRQHQEHATQHQHRQCSPQGRSPFVPGQAQDREPYGHSGQQHPDQNPRQPMFDPVDNRERNSHHGDYGVDRELAARTHTQGQQYQHCAGKERSRPPGGQHTGFAAAEVAVSQAASGSAKNQSRHSTPGQPQTGHFVSAGYHSAPNARLVQLVLAPEALPMSSCCAHPATAALSFMPKGEHLAEQSAASSGGRSSRPETATARCMKFCDRSATACNCPQSRGNAMNPDRSAHRAPAIAVTVLALSLTACSSGNNTTPTPSPTIAPSSTSTPSAAPVEPAKQGAIDAYLGMWSDMADAATTSDWQAPKLAQNATGEALQTITRSLYADRYNGLITRGRPVNDPAVTSVNPQHNPTSVTITDCGDSTNWLKYRADNGQPADDGPAGHRQIEAIVKKAIDGSWKVTTFAVHEVGSCVG
jgi:hypothetical protein